MGHVWENWAIFMICVIILSFLMSAPTALVNKVLKRFELHPKLVESEVVSISRGAMVITGEEKQKIIQEFNGAATLDRRYSNFPTYQDEPITIHVIRKGRDEEYSIYPYGKFLDIVKRIKNKTIVYQLKSDELKNRFASA